MSVQVGVMVASLLTRVGSGILSYMAAQAGAKEVIALEASSMADKIQTVS